MQNPSDREWDVILIGASQNTFALGTYLGRAGLRTVVCESRLENGGRLSSEELLLPGYWNNVLSYFVDKVDVNPVWRELGWVDEHHATFIVPSVISTLLLPDGESISHFQDLDATVASVSRFSGRDAEAWRTAHDTYGHLVRSFLIPSLLEPPASGDRVAVLDADPAGDQFLRLCRMTARQVVDELFENDVVKTLVLSQMAIPRGVAVDYEGGGAEVLLMIAGDEKPMLTRGGIHEIAQVLQRAYVHSGGQIRAMHHVDRILVEDGRAVGVRLRDGRAWRARMAVVSGVDPHTTFLDMVGEDKLPRDLVQRVRSLQYDEFSYFQVHLALRSRVRYALHEVKEPSVAQAMNVTIGPISPADLDAMWQEIRAGEFPRHYCLHITCPTALDPLQAPTGKHNASLFMPVPYQLGGHPPEAWIKLKYRYMEVALSEWRRHATNLQDDNIVGRAPMDPWYLSGKWQNLRFGSVNVLRRVPTQMGANRPLPELANYRTPVDRLYMVGVSTHPADAMTAGSGRNAWQVIRADLKLETAQPARA
jgi:phytoene dehydrogenase-like protein